MFTSRFAIMVAALTALLLLGFGERASAGEELASVTGVVTLEGEPLGTGKVTFHLKDGQFVGSKINKDGTYKVDRVPVGAHTITIVATQRVDDREFNFLRPIYASEDKSPLRVEVKKGGNRCDFNLKSRGDN